MDLTRGKACAAAELLMQRSARRGRDVIRPLRPSDARRRQISGVNGLALRDRRTEMHQLLQGGGGCVAMTVRYVRRPRVLHCPFLSLFSTAGNTSFPESLVRTRRGAVRHQTLVFGFSFVGGFGGGGSVEVGLATVVCFTNTAASPVFSKPYRQFIQQEMLV